MFPQRRRGCYYSVYLLVGQWHIAGEQIMTRFIEMEMNALWVVQSGALHGEEPHRRLACRPDWNISGLCIAVHIAGLRTPLVYKMLQSVRVSLKQQQQHKQHLFVRAHAVRMHASGWMVAGKEESSLFTAASLNQQIQETSWVGPDSKTTLYVQVARIAHRKSYIAHPFL